MIESVQSGRGPFPSPLSVFFSAGRLEGQGGGPDQQAWHPALLSGPRPGAAVCRGPGGGKALSRCLRDPCLLCHHQKGSGGGGQDKASRELRRSVRIRASITRASSAASPARRSGDGLLFLPGPGGGRECEGGDEVRQWGCYPADSAQLGVGGVWFPWGLPEGCPGMCICLLL